ncbi:hypothetical protein KUTeg_021630 [Tegillarca granosa]|uniref:Uncharacterized protein n=1 Tax=Tegillarca granosa TaxID=220873 RepID=A0ABQ9E3V2_TEGGR|nr:hypothetical protein KUTeg_021630 [Tegillarca granosa]
MEGDSKGAVKRSNPSAGGESNPAKMMKTGTQTNTGSYGTGQTSSTTVTTTRKPQYPRENSCADITPKDIVREEIHVHFYILIAAGYQVD